MHQLQRGPAPQCLSGASKSLTWQTLGPECKAAVREALEEMQTSGRVLLCAYCECAIDGRSRNHIEHLAPRWRFPQYGLSWPNLFLSCDNRNHCGRYKDHVVKHYEPADVVHPDVEDPDDLLQFFTDGSVAPKAGISEGDRARALKTIEVLGLDAPTLVERRREAVRGAVADAECIPDLLSGLSVDEVQQFLHEEAIRSAGQPHETVFRHMYLSLTSTTSER